MKAGTEHGPEKLGSRLTIAVLTGPGAPGSPGLRGTPKWAGCEGRFQLGGQMHLRLLSF